MKENHLLAGHDWSFPVPIAYGPGRLAELPQHCAAAGMKNPLLMSDRGRSSAADSSCRQRHSVGAALPVGLDRRRWGRESSSRGLQAGDFPSFASRSLTVGLPSATGPGRDSSSGPGTTG